MRWFIYSVLLILILTAGCDVLPFGGNEPPVAYIDSISPSEAAAGETVAFVGHGTDADGTVVGYKWRSYVDGDLSTLATFNSSELSEGEHTIYLSVQDNNGDWSEEVASNIIVGATSEGFTEEGAFEEVETGTPSEDTTSTELPYINYLTAEPAVISPGSASVVRWSVSNAQSVTGSYDSTVIPLPATGSGTVRPTRTTVYTVSASSGASTVSATVTVTVQGTSPGSAEEAGTTEETPASEADLPVITVSVTPAYIEPGTSATISWNASNATQVTMTSPTGTKSLTHMAGSTDVSPTSTTTYTFTATNSTGNKSANIVVTVLVPEWKTVTLHNIPGESGSVNSAHAVSPKIIAGDDNANTTYQAFIIFNISSLAGKQIQKAEILCTTSGATGKPWTDLNDMTVWLAYYGRPRPLMASDYATEGHLGTSQQTISSQAELSSPILINPGSFQNAVTSGLPRVQVRLSFKGATDHDNKADNVGLTKADLRVVYR